MSITPTFEAFISQFATASEDRKQAALSAGIEALRGEELKVEDEPWLSLKQTAAALGYADCTLLHRLRVQCVGEALTPGGRKKYRLSQVREYLASPEASAAREALRHKRRESSGGKTDE